ncbi:vesicular integral-membrane protein VIP36 [Chrysoperla carnea]|uniref:vesicular integral-membrane protein VIP36 n=1 Tax=Chrysoperla carnea TaxID=189513 RepID=UPI001D095E44|nr:vesicular integral-membrane protein VIP36 [Chrysoperla carnea]
MYKYILLLLLIIVINEIKGWNTKDYMKREHSLIKPYHRGTKMSIPYWDFMGSTLVTNDYIRLTPDEQSKNGALWNTEPCLINNWELQIHFKVHGKGKDLFGDGLAIWYTKDRMLNGPVFGNIDYFNGLAIILDTYSNHNGAHNHQHPYISAMINNGTLHYDHDRDGTHTQIAGCEAKIRNLEFDTHISIKYLNNQLIVSTDLVNKAAWHQCFQVDGIFLPTGYYFGVSATTGDLSDYHDILSIKLYELEGDDNNDRSKISPSASYFTPPRDHIEDPKQSSLTSSLSGVKVFLLMLVGAVVFVACIVLSIMFYQKQQEQNRKRFY